MERACDVCGTVYQAQRVTSKYCSGRCRVRASRAGQTGRPPGAADATVTPLRKPGRPKGAGGRKPAADPGGVDEFVASARARLVRVDRLESVAGRQAMFLAGQFSNPMNSAAGLASLSKEFRAVMEVALEGTQLEVDPLDELRERRDAKRDAG